MRIIIIITKDFKYDDKLKINILKWITIISRDEKIYWNYFAEWTALFRKCDFKQFKINLVDETIVDNELCHYTFTLWYQLHQNIMIDLPKFNQHCK